jgi:hypothetical protein
VISLSDQLAYLYRGNALVAVSTVSSGKDEKPTPTGIFSVLDKKPFYRSKKYDNAPMPWMQRIDQYGVALHAGYNPGTPASHGCVPSPECNSQRNSTQSPTSARRFISARNLPRAASGNGARPLLFSRDKRFDYETNLNRTERSRFEPQPLFSFRHARD